MSNSIIDTTDWDCEQNVVATVVTLLQHGGWVIESIADTETVH
jgi:hypothetical protein